MADEKLYESFLVGIRVTGVNNDTDSWRTGRPGDDVVQGDDHPIKSKKTFTI